MTQVLDFIKRHTLALACGVVALIAIGALLFWIPGMIADVQSTVQTETIEPQTALETVSKQQRTYPIVDMNAAEPRPLEAFPTQQTVEQGRDALRRLKEQSDAALAELRRANERPLLVPNSLPEPSSLARQTFYNAYRDATAQGNGAESGIIRRVLQGSLPPTEAELTQLGNLRANQILTRQLSRDATGRPTNQPQVDATIAAMRARLEVEERIGRARTSKIYVSLNAVDIHPFLNQSVQQLDAPTIFNAQMSLWLQQIAMEAIADCNSQATNVFDAPVKHLVRLNVPMEVAPIASGGRTGGGGFGAAMASPEEGGVDLAATLTPDPTAAITPSYNTSPYGYAHNNFYDAVPISMIIRLDVRQLPQVLATLGRGRLLKVNNVNLRTVDAGVALAEKYIYDQTGKTPLVEARIDCDVLFLRTWLAPLMPREVKAYFANLSNPQPAM